MTKQQFISNFNEQMKARMTLFFKDGFLYYITNEEYINRYINKKTEEILQIINIDNLTSLDVWVDFTNELKTISFFKIIISFGFEDVFIYTLDLDLSFAIDTKYCKLA